MTTTPLFPILAATDSLQQALIAAFPAEDVAIRAYFKDVAGAAAVAGLALPLPLLPGWMRGEERAGDYLARNFRDPALRTLLVQQAAAAGGAGDDTPFFQHALAVQRTLQRGPSQRGASQHGSMAA